MFGFFSSEALRSISPGLAEYLVRTENPMRLVVSPNISDLDYGALRDGVSTPQEVLENRLKELLGEAKVSASALVEHTLECLAYLLSTNRLKIRIAWLKDGGLFHPKVWFFRDKRFTVVAHGSSNFTLSGLTRNHEQIRVETSWRGELANESIDILTEEFEALWNGSQDYVLSLDLPTAISNDLIREYTTNSPPSPDDFRRAWNEDANKVKALVRPKTLVHGQMRDRLEIPQGLDLYSGRFGHQGKAVESWEYAGRRGIFAMATGSGKTIAALGATVRLQEDYESLLVVVSAPYRPLVSQWIEETNAFGVQPLFSKGTTRELTNRLDLAVRRLVSKVSTLQIAVVTHKYLARPDFHALLESIPEQVKTLLIADEVHNLGSAGFISDPPQRFDFRLGLSATPERQYDPDGTQSLFEYFGETVFEFSLEDAIGVCLVPYNYYIHRVCLADTEFEEWQRLTRQLVRAGFSGGDQDPSDSGKLSATVTALLNKRRKVIESAENKVHTLRSLLGGKSRDDIRHTLVYATDKGRDQLISANRMLQEDLHLTIHQLTADETKNKLRASRLLDHFSAGQFQVITCMRVLDEGVDVPQVSVAYLLASNTVKRQWIQRRGRILRRCDAIDKRLAHLHDFVVIPPDPAAAEGRAILRSELARAQEFAGLAANAGADDGPFAKIEGLLNEMYR